MTKGPSTADIRERTVALFEQLSVNDRRWLLQTLRATLPGSDHTVRDDGDRSQDTLTRRECDVLALIANGYTRTEIARSLSISANTAATHIASIYRKRGIGSIAEATRMAIRSGVVEL